MRGGLHLKEAFDFTGAFDLNLAADEALKLFAVFPRNIALKPFCEGAHLGFTGSTPLNTQTVTGDSRHIRIGAENSLKIGKHLGVAFSRGHHLVDIRHQLINQIRRLGFGHCPKRTCHCRRQDEGTANHQSFTT